MISVYIYNMVHIFMMKNNIQASSFIVKHKIIIIFIAIFCLFLVPDKMLVANPKVVIYLPSWINWELDTIDVSKVDEIKLGFFTISEDYEIINGVDASGSTFDEIIKRLQDLKEKYPKIKVSITLGGGTYSPDKFSRVISSYKGREKIIANVVEKLQQIDFDGVAIDWEFPNSNKDKVNFTLFIKDLKVKMDNLAISTKKKYLLSYSVPAGSWIAKFIDIPKTLKYVDYIEIMSYDLVGRSSEMTGHLANLYSSIDGEWSTSKAVDYFYSIGVPKEKMLMGVPFYGIKFDYVKSKNNNGLYQDIDNQKSNRVHYISYSQIMIYYITDKNFKLFFSDEANSSYLFNEKEQQFITFLNQNEVSRIVNYIKTNKMYGVMIWHLWQDDYKNTLTDRIYYEIEP